MRNISGTEKFYKRKRCGSTISISLYFYLSFIEKIILSSENRLLDNTFDVPEVLNVRVNENNKKNLLFLEGFFFKL